MSKILPLYFLLIILACSSCSKPQKPSFKKVRDIEVDMISTSRISIKAKAVYHNPNQIGGLLTKTEVKVQANDIEVADITQTLDTPIPAGSDFEIPLNFETSPKKIFESDKGGIIGSVINAVANRKIELHYKGHATISLAGIPYRIPVDYKEEVGIK